MYWWIYF